MKAQNKKERDGVLTLVTYTSLYINDMVCNSIIELQPYVEKKDDKETKKIYKALYKRANEYLNSVNYMEGVDIYFLADVFAFLDEDCDMKIKSLQKEIVTLFENQGVENAQYYAMLETMRMLAEYSTLTIECLIKDSKDIAPESLNLKRFILYDVLRVANNLTAWEYRHIKKDITINTEDQEGAVEKFRTLIECLIDYERLNKALHYAEEENKQRKEWKAHTLKVQESMNEQNEH